MPNWMNALNTAMTPMVPKRAISGLQEAISPGSSADLPAGEGWLGRLNDIPDALRDLAGLGLEDIPEAAGGFLSGALEGARGMTTPLDAAALAAPGALGAVGALGRTAPVVSQIAKRAAPTIDILEDVPLRQITPNAQVVDELVTGLGQRMREIPQATGRIRRPGQNPAIQALEQQPAPRPMQPPQAPPPGPEFVPVGGEAAYNAGRGTGFGMNQYGKSDPYETAAENYRWKTRSMGR